MSDAFTSKLRRIKETRRIKTDLETSEHADFRDRWKKVSETILGPVLKLTEAEFLGDTPEVSSEAEGDGLVLRVGSETRPHQLRIRPDWLDQRVFVKTEIWPVGGAETPFYAHQLTRSKVEAIVEEFLQKAFHLR